MTPLRLITSGAYVEQELSAEFGSIPPSFLPIGVSRLYEAQVASLGPGRVYLSIPESYTPPEYDLKRLQELDVVLVPVPEGLRLGESVLYAINYIAAPEGALHLLHGDTLIEDLPQTGDDLIAAKSGGDDYSWAAVSLSDDRVSGLNVLLPGGAHEASEPVACGYFRFSDRSQLVRALTRTRGDFIAAINTYVHDIDVRAASVERWLDFGHIQTYFRSKRAVSTARAFNTLHIDSRTVRKSSADVSKMRAESEWLRNVPSAVQPYAARLFQSGEQDGRGYYSVGYEYAPTLSEIFVFAAVGRATWRNIFDSCQEFLSACATVEGPGSADAHLRDLAADKTMARLEQYAQQSGLDIDKPMRFDGRDLPSLRRIAEEMAEAIDYDTGRRETVMHGDFCFSNILYDSRARKVVVIDPRGYVQHGSPSIYGDQRYDLAKLSHSVVGSYDRILAGRYVLAQNSAHDLSIHFEVTPHDQWLEDAAAELATGGHSIKDIGVRALTVGLFLSMLPLHADRPDRQTAFIANALRLYSRLERIQA